MKSIYVSSKSWRYVLYLSLFFGLLGYSSAFLQYSWNTDIRSSNKIPILSATFNELRTERYAAYYRWSYPSYLKITNAHIFQGLKLNAILERLYTKNTYEESDLVLDDFEHILESIGIYKEVYRDLDIPNKVSTLYLHMIPMHNFVFSLKFDVPAESSWPSHLHGLRFVSLNVLNAINFLIIFPN
jgi:hypothetical protein